MREPTIAQCEQEIVALRDMLRMEKAENERLRQTINNGSSLFAELFNRMPVKELKESVPIEIAKRIGDFMVSQGYRIVFDRWYLQAKPSPSSAPATHDKPWWCPTCRTGLDPVDVTYQETHDVRSGGCGSTVRPINAPAEPGKTTRLYGLGDSDAFWNFGRHQQNTDTHYIDINEETGAIVGGKIT